MRNLLWSQKRKLCYLVATSLCYSVVCIGSAEYLGILMDRSSEFIGNMALFYTVVGLLLVGLMYVTDLCNENMVVKIKNEILYRIRSEVVSKILGQKQVKNVLENKNAEYSALLVNDLVTLEDNFLVPLLNVIYQTVLIVVSAIFISFQSPVITLVILLFSIVIIFIPSKMASEMQIKQDEFIEENTVFMDEIDEVLQGTSLFYTTNSTNLGKQLFNNKNRKQKDKKILFEKMQNKNWISAQNLSLLAQYLVTFICLAMISNGKLTIGVLFTVLNSMNILIYPVTNIFQYVQQIKSSLTLIKKYEEYFDKENNHGVVSNEELTGISLSNVSVEIDTKEILTDITVQFQPHKRYLIVGKSGSGKSTLAKVLSGMLVPTSGAIDTSQEIRWKNVGLCTHSPFLLNKSIIFNIQLAQKQDSAWFDKCVQWAEIDDLIRGDKAVGKNGDNISSGQKSRVVIARELYHHKKWLILDEALSVLDSISRDKVENHLIEEFDGTVITITHQCSVESVKKYDEIITMKDGKITNHISVDALESAGDINDMNRWIQAQL